VSAPGERFGNRVAASLNLANGCAELVPRTADDYVQLATSVLRSPPKLAALKRKLGVQRGAGDLFDTRKRARELERSYRAMWELSALGISMHIVP
jgi:predicted O-linked N-acetylglucosamine transferase (SPINDLY family)